MRRDASVWLPLPRIRLDAVRYVVVGALAERFARNRAEVVIFLSESDGVSLVCTYHIILPSVG